MRSSGALKAPRPRSRRDGQDVGRVPDERRPVAGIAEERGLRPARCPASASAAAGPGIGEERQGIHAEHEPGTGTANNNPASGGPSTVPVPTPLAGRWRDEIVVGHHSRDTGRPPRTAAYRQGEWKTTTSRASGGAAAPRSGQTAWVSQPTASSRPGLNRSAITPANGAASGGIACANSNSPTAVALPRGPLHVQDQGEWSPSRRRAG